MTVEEQAVSIAKEEILKILAIEEPYIFAANGIYHKVKELQNGEMQIHLRIKDGFVTDLVATEVKRYVYKKQGK